MPQERPYPITLDERRLSTLSRPSSPSGLDMPDTANDPSYPLALRQADEARADFYALQDDPDCIKRQLARQPDRAWLARMGLIGFDSLWALLAAVLLMR